MLKLQIIKDKFSNRKIILKEVAEKIGIPYHTLRNTLFYSKNPPYQNIEKISDFIEKGGLKEYE